MQCSQVTVAIDDPARQLHGRHQAAGLDRVRVFNPQPQIFSGILRRAGGNGVAAHQVRQVGPELSFASVPAMVWQLTQAVASNTWRPLCTWSAYALPALFCCCTQRWKSSGDSTITRSSILACWTPQYCAHCPTYVPASCGSIHISFVRLGIRSVLPASCGTQKLWSVSAESKLDMRRRADVRPRSPERATRWP